LGLRYTVEKRDLSWHENKRPHGIWTAYFDLLKATGNWWTANVEHKALRDALVRKDGDAARWALQADIEGAAAALQSVLVAQKQAAEESKPRRKRKMP
jgi:DNA-binding GntR family transcriptional regulator